MVTRQHAPHALSSARGGTLAWSWPAAALGAVLGLAAALYGYGLDQNGYANQYYAAAVRSMLQSWYNFFFVAFDPGGFVSVDKPPLGLWFQVASARLFGFSGLSILLPQAVAGVAAVAVLYWTVRRGFGVPAALVAALALALTPITVATSRNNTSDVPLVLILVLAALALLQATETGRLRWLVAGAALVGAGFNVKMLEAFLPLPAFYLTYLVGAPRPWRTRIVHLAVATLALLAVALPWAIAVDLTPADQRPYVGSSADNTVRNLVLGYNGLTRLLGIGAPGGSGGALPGAPAGSPPSPAGAPGLAPGAAPPPGFPPGPPPGGGPFAGETGRAGPLRLFNQQLAGQISWLLPLALFGLAAAVGREGRRWPLNHRQQALLLWSGWLLTAAVFFSVAGMFHRYYLVLLGPPIAALVGISGTALWAGYRGGGLRAWLLPLALLTTTTVQLRILADYPDWSNRLAVPISALGVVAALTLVLAHVRPRLGRTLAPALAAGASGIALLLAPAVWAAYPLADTDGGRNMLPFAGPAGSSGGPFLGPPGGGPPPFGAPGPAGGPPPGLPPPPGMGNDSADPRLLDYLQANRGGATFILATPSAMQAAPLILATGEPVMALGGFSGGDPILTPEGLARLVAQDTVRYFLLPAAGGFPGGMPGPGGPGRADVTRWVTDRCASVPADLWQSTVGETPRQTRRAGTPPGFPPSGAPAGFPPPPGLGFERQLYDCAGAT